MSPRLAAGLAGAAAAALPSPALAHGLHAAGHLLDTLLMLGAVVIALGGSWWLRRRRRSRHEDEP
jgi:LPXTG-motif cell wall-anchored protein